MAEENPLENELDQPTDEQENFDLEDLDADATDIADDQQESSQAVASTGRFSNIINSIKTNRRSQFLLGGIGLVLIVIISFMIASPDKKEEAVNPGMTQAEAPNFSSEEIVNKKSSKKKKKKVKYVDLYKQLESKQINPILRELSYKSISYNVVQNGKQFDLQVDEDQLDEAKQILAIKGLPSGTVKGYEIFDEASNLGVTEFD